MRALTVLLGLTACGVSSWAVAAPSSAVATPGTLSASLQSTLPTTLVWTVTVTFAPTSAVAPGLTLISPQGTVSTPSGQVLQIDPVPLTVRLGPGGQGNVAETFTLAPSTIATALHLGVGTLYLRRTFGLKPYGAVGTAVITLGGSASGPLTLSQVSLHFDDRALVRVLRAGESAVAIAEITYSGSGVLNGLWEVAAPPSTQGEPLFVPLGTSAANLTAGGLTEVTSPALPSLAAGVYYVRFRVRSPVVPFESLVLRYGVEATSSEAAPIAVLAPEPHAMLTADTRFAWQPAPGAIAYRLEFFDADDAADERPVSGQWVPAAQRAAALTALAQTHLRPGQVYRWRIVALSPESEVIGRSALYEIRTP